MQTHVLQGWERSPDFYCKSCPCSKPCAQNSRQMYTLHSPIQTCHGFLLGHDVCQLQQQNSGIYGQCFIAAGLFGCMVLVIFVAVLGWLVFIFLFVLGGRGLFLFFFNCIIVAQVGFYFYFLVPWDRKVP